MHMLRGGPSGNVDLEQPIVFQKYLRGAKKDDTTQACTQRHMHAHKKTSTCIYTIIHKKYIRTLKARKDTCMHTRKHAHASIPLYIKIYMHTPNSKHKIHFKII